jgi:hypothetical protein
MDRPKHRLKHRFGSRAFLLAAALFVFVLVLLFIPVFLLFFLLFVFVLVLFLFPMDAWAVFLVPARVFLVLACVLFQKLARFAYPRSMI